MTVKYTASLRDRWIGRWRDWSIHTKCLIAVIALDVISLAISVRSLPIKRPYYDYYYIDSPFGRIPLEFIVFIAICCVAAIALWATLVLPNRWQKAARERRHGRSEEASGISGFTWADRYRILHLFVFYASLTLALTGPIYFRNGGEFFVIPRYGLRASPADLFSLITAFASLGAAFLLLRSGARASASTKHIRPTLSTRESADQELSDLFATAEAIEREVVEMKSKLSVSLEMLTAGTRRVETELRARRAKLEELATEAAQYEQTARLHKETSDAVRDFLTAKVSEQLISIDKNSRRNQLVFFFVGVLVSIPIGVIINLVTK